MSKARPDLGTHAHRQDSAYIKATQDTCAECGKWIDPTLKWPHPMSFSVGHKIAANRGGAHARWNKQAEHLHCNTAKQDRVQTTTPNQSRRW